MFFRSRHTFAAIGGLVLLLLVTGCIFFSKPPLEALVASEACSVLSEIDDLLADLSSPTGATTLETLRADVNGSLQPGKCVGIYRPDILRPVDQSRAQKSL